MKRLVYRELALGQTSQLVQLKAQHRSSTAELGGTGSNLPFTLSKWERACTHWKQNPIVFHFPQLSISQLV